LQVVYPESVVRYSELVVISYLKIAVCHPKLSVSYIRAASCYPEPVVRYPELAVISYLKIAVCHPKLAVSYIRAASCLS